MVYAYVDYEPEDDTYLQGMKGNATYREIKEWIKAEYGMSVSSLYVAQIKDKCGFEKRQNYNIGENKTHVPNCPPEKEKAILEAFKHFRMILEIVGRKGSTGIRMLRNVELFFYA